MLTRYKIYRGKRPPDDPLPSGDRQDTRKHTRHVLRPTPDIVEAYLGAPSAEAWRTFRGAYLDVLERRFAAERARFDELAKAATSGDVSIGCSCPTKKNPDVRRCHTFLALRFLQEKYPGLVVKLPEG